MKATDTVRIEERRNEVASLYLQGYLLKDIAAKFHLSINQIFKDLTIIRRRWREETLHNISEITNRELAKIDQVEIEAWNGWRRTLTDKEKRQIKLTIKGEEKVQSKEGQAGDPRFLELILRCSERRCKLLGIEKTENNLFFQQNNQNNNTIQLLDIGGDPIDFARSEKVIKEKEGL